MCACCMGGGQVEEISQAAGSTAGHAERVTCFRSSTWEKPGSLSNELIADLREHACQARGSVVELGVLPDEQQSVHERPEDLCEGLEVIQLAQLLQQLPQRCKVAHVVIGLCFASLHLLDQSEGQTNTLSRGYIQKASSIGDDGCCCDHQPS